jgi:hypothetical protein
MIFIINESANKLLITIFTRKNGNGHATAPKIVVSNSKPLAGIVECLGRVAPFVS